MGINVRVQKAPKARNIVTVEARLERDLRSCMRCRNFHGNNRQCIAKKCVKEDVRLEQYAITSGDDLEKGFFGIEEPITGKCRQIKAPHEGICIVPGLAFDENGIRMGYGKGYYDRFLASFRGIRIGLCYECCIYSGTLPHDEYDAQMDLVISEKMVRKMKRGV